MKRLNLIALTCLMITLAISGYSVKAVADLRDFSAGHTLAEASMVVDARMYNLHLPTQSVAEALTLLSEQTDLLVLFPYEIAASRTANAVVGRYRLQQALDLMLAGTGLSGGLTQDDVITISLRPNERVGDNMNSKKQMFAALTAFFMGSSASVGALGQEVEAHGGRAVLDEVVVTAQKRDESMQDVPISISAFSGHQLAQSGVTGTLDLEMVTPGLSIETENRNARIFIRGIGSTRLGGPGADPSASTYIDGVYQARFDGAFVDLMDVERVEVLKGPQGTLYGRNSTGGAIKYISKKPAAEFGGEIKADIGNYNLKTVSAAFDTPLVQDKLLMRTSVMKKDRDGYMDIVNLPGKKNDREDLLAGRITLHYLPADNLDIIFHAAAVNDDGDVTARKHYIDTNSGLVSTAQAISDPWKVNTEHADDMPGRLRVSDLTVNWDLDWAQLTSITGYTDSSFGPYLQDFDGTELRIWAQGRPATDTNPAIDGLRGDSQTLTQEITLASSSDALDWTVGIFYLEEEAFWLSGFDIATIPLYASRRGISNVEAYAAFADASYTLTEKLKLNVGIRYSSETKEYTQRTENTATVDGAHVQTIGEWTPQEESWDDWTPKVGLSYSISDDVMAYVSVSQGFKSGGYNFTGGEPVDPEEITAYEVGVKSMLLDGRLRLNVSAFDYDYENLQVQSFDTVTNRSFLSNAAESEIQGLEVAATALLSESFQVDVGLSFLDAKYGEFIKKNPDDPDPAATINVSGNSMPQAPEFTASIGLSHSYLLEGVGTIESRLDYYYSDEKFFDDFNNPLLVQESYELINANIGLESQDGIWNIALWGKNLTDELVFTGMASPPPFGDEGFIASLAAPRTYGLSVSYNF